MTDEKLKEITGLNLDQLNDLKINSEELSVLDPIDKKFVLLSGAITYINGLNTVDRTIMGIEHTVRSMVPAPVEDLKILISRLDDIKPEEIDDLSSAFIENTFTVNGKKLPLTKPEVGDYNELEFERVMIRNLKVMDEQTAVAMEYKKKILENYERDIPEDIRAMAGNIEEIDNFMINYFEDKAKNQDISEEKRKDYEKRLKYKKYARTLEPITNSFIDTVNKKNGKNSLLHGFYKDRQRVFDAAVQIASKNHFTFPFRMLTNIDIKLCGEKFKPYRNLFIYLVARYIRYHRDNITEYDRIFLTDLFATLVVLNRPDAEEKYPDLYKEMQQSMKAVMTLATGIN